MKLFLFCISLFFIFKCSCSLKCYNCHKDHVNCSSNPTTFYLRDCDPEVSHCYTQIGVTLVRGCFFEDSGLSLRSNARLCSTNGCNNEPFVVKSQLECQKCRSPNCPKEVAPCNYSLPLYWKDYCYTLKNINGSTERGCFYEATLEVQKMCNPREPHRDRCVTCQFSRCNEHLNPITNSMCVTSMPKADSKSCDLFQISSHLGCYAKITNSAMTVGCASQMRNDEFMNCATMTNSSCQLCVTPLCNKNILGHSLTSCAYGNSFLTLTSKFCNKVDDRCVMYKAFGQVSYNCESSMNCFTEFCYFCWGNLCNKQLEEYISCHKCNETVECEQDLRDIDKYKMMCGKTKNKNNELCYSVITSRGEVTRGCYSENTTGKVECDSLPNKCMKCKGNYCNSAKVLVSSLACFECNRKEKTCPYGMSITSSSTKCLNLFKGQEEQCFNTYFKADNSSERGCYLDVNNKTNVEIKTGKLSLCSGNFCNNQAYVLRKCYSCSGSQRGSKCHDINEKADSQMVLNCQPRLDHRNGISCYTMLFVNQTIRRGCTSTMTKDSHAACVADLNKNCLVCNEDLCNHEKYIQDRCFKCDNCGDKVKDVEQRQCDILSSPERRGCFTWRSLNNKKRRGCVAELTAVDYQICGDHKEVCKVCEGDGCNNVDVDSIQEFEKVTTAEKSSAKTFFITEITDTLLLIFIVGLIIVFNKIISN